MKLLSCLSLGTFLLVALIHLSNAAEEKSAVKKKLQIGVKKRVENCEQKSRRGDLLSMHYTVSFSYTLKPRYNEPQNSEFLDIVNKTQLPFEDLLSISYLM